MKSSSAIWTKDLNSLRSLRQPAEGEGMNRRYNGPDPIKEAFALELTKEFLAWLEERRYVLVLRFRMALDQELLLERKWHEEVTEASGPITQGQFNTDTFKRLCVVTLIRQRIEHVLNLIDFGGDFGPLDFRFRKKLINQWIKHRSKRTSTSEAA
jgi:hypothetical protein